MGLASSAGVAGASALGASFGLLPAPPPISAARTALMHFGISHHNLILLAAWLEGSGTGLYVIFALTLVHLAGSRAGLAGRVTALSSAAVLAVSLLYDATLIATAQSAVLGGQQASTALVAYGLFAATEHLFLLAPPLLLPLGLILARTALLPRAFARLAVLLGVLGPVLGLVGLFTVTGNNNGLVGMAINVLVAAQGFWMIGASVALWFAKPGRLVSQRGDGVLSVVRCL
jgi:hypothetical protein